MRRVDSLQREGCNKTTVSVSGGGSARVGAKVRGSIDTDGCVPWIGSLDLLRDPWVGGYVNQVSFFLLLLSHTFLVYKYGMR